MITDGDFQCNRKTRRWRKKACQEKITRPFGNKEDANNSQGTGQHQIKVALQCCRSNRKNQNRENANRSNLCHAKHEKTPWWRQRHSPCG